MFLFKGRGLISGSNPSPAPPATHYTLSHTAPCRLALAIQGRVKGLGFEGFTLQACVCREGRTPKNPFLGSFPQKNPSKKNFLGGRTPKKHTADKINGDGRNTRCASCDGRIEYFFTKNIHFFLYIFGVCIFLNTKCTTV